MFKLIICHHLCLAPFAVFALALIGISRMVDYPVLLRRVLQDYQLPQRGIHGIYHWARVWENGLRLAESSGADVTVVKLFSILHDARRRNENRDHQHGLRGAEYARSLRGEYFELGDREFELLYVGCRDHTDGSVELNSTIQTCWAADRLDLPRVGITIDPDRLGMNFCTNQVLVEWAMERSKNRALPTDTLALWGFTEQS